MTKRILLAVALMLAIANVAAAQIHITDRTERWDLSIQTRYTAEHTFDEAYGTQLQLSDDLGWGFGFAYNLNPRWNLGFLMSWRSIGYNAVYSDSAGAPLNYGGWLDTGTLAATATFYLLPKSFTPYVSGLVGWTMVDTNIVADYQVGCWYDPWWGYICNGYTSTYGWDGLCYGAGAGVRWEPSEAVYIQVGYEWNELDLNKTNQFQMFRVDLGFTN